MTGLPKDFAFPKTKAKPGLNSLFVAVFRGFFQISDLWIIGKKAC